jgi:hypothetical protein
VPIFITQYTLTPMEESKKTIEAKAAATLLQKVEEVKVGGKTYHVAPPSVATLALASEAISKLPKVQFDDKKIIQEALYWAKDLRGIADVCAIFILGAKNVNNLIFTQEVHVKRLLWGLITRKTTVDVSETAIEVLRRDLLEEMTPRDLNALMTRLINQTQVGDFFGVTTFLTEINLLRPTKVETEATASGRS